MMMFDYAQAQKRGWTKLNPNPKERTPREELLAMGLCNGLQPENFTSDGWVSAFSKDVRGTKWAIWRSVDASGPNFRSARIAIVGKIERYTDHQTHESLRGAIKRIETEGVMQ